MTNTPRYQLEQELLDTMTNLDNAERNQRAIEYINAVLEKAPGIYLNYTTEQLLVMIRHLLETGEMVVNDKDIQRPTTDVYPYGPDYC